MKTAGDQMKQNNIKRSVGFSSLELVVTTMLFIPLTIFSLDLSIIVFGVQINNDTCKEIARVASSGAPANAQTRATAILNQRSRTTKSFITLKLADLRSTVTPDQAKALEPLGGPIDGSVTAMTEVQVRPLLIDKIINGPISFRASYTIPYTYVVPNTVQ